MKIIPLLVIVFAITVCVLNLTQLPKALRTIGGDFNMRYNEVQCVREGINPYDIWSGALPSTKYYGIYKGNPNHAPDQIHAYSPWEYTYLLPLSFFPKRTASFMFHCLCLFILINLAVFAWCEVRKMNCSKWEAAFCAVSVFLVGPGLNACFDTQNYGILASGAILAMVVTLRRNYDFWAGIAWAVLMTKPQNGVLFVFPLLFARRWKVIAVAMAICSVSIIPPSWMTNTSPIDLGLCLANIRSGDVISTTLFPEPVFVCLSMVFGQPVILAASAILGCLVCGWLSYRTRNSSDWLYRLFPAILCSLAWTYKMPYDYCMFSLALLVVAREIIFTDGLGRTLAFGALSCALVPYLHYLCPETLIGRILWKGLRVPCKTSFSHHVLIFIQFVELFAFFALCLWFYRLNRHRSQESFA